MSDRPEMVLTKLATADMAAAETALAAVAGALFPSQDPGGQAMAAGAVFLVGAVLGFGVILAAIVRCFRRSC